jgi:hypothetical protein
MDYRTDDMYDRDTPCNSVQHILRHLMLLVGAAQSSVKPRD